VGWASDVLIALVSLCWVIAGPDRRIYLPEGLLDKSDIPAYLTGEVPGE